EDGESAGLRDHVAANGIVAQHLPIADLDTAGRNSVRAEIILRKEIARSERGVDCVRVELRRQRSANDVVICGRLSGWRELIVSKGCRKRHVRIGDDARCELE